MQDIKHFKPVTPAPELMDYMPLFASSPQLQSEDGRDWYACQSAFSDNTIKIMYDANGIIRSVVDKPVPQRGNVYAVSMFFPDGYSVAEIAQEDWPEGANHNGEWIFDGEAILPRIPTHKEQVVAAELQKRELHTTATKMIELLQDAVDVKDAAGEDKQLLLKWKAYRLALSRIDTSLAPVITWPEQPAGAL